MFFSAIAFKFKDNNTKYDDGIIIQPTPTKLPLRQQWHRPEAKGVESETLLAGSWWYPPSTLHCIYFYCISQRQCLRGAGDIWFYARYCICTIHYTHCLVKGLVSGDIHQNTLQHLSSNISPPLIVLHTPRWYLELPWHLNFSPQSLHLNSKFGWKLTLGSKCQLRLGLVSISESGLI